MNQLLLLGAGQGVFISFFLLTHIRGNIKANRLLAALILSFAFYIAVPVLYQTNPDDFSHLIGIAFIPIFLFGPLTYLYTIELTATYNLNYKKWLHFLPGALILLYFLPHYLSSSGEKIEFLNKIKAEGLPTNLVLIWGLACIQIIIYNFLSIKMLKSYQAYLLENFSEIRFINLKWLVFFMYFNVFVWIIYTVIFLINLKVEIDPFGVADKLFNLMLVVFIYGISYNILMRPEIFSGVIKKVPSHENKYKKSAIKENEAKKILNTLKHFMQEKRPHLDPDITLNDLSKQAGINDKYLSQVMNQLSGMNFYGFVNSYRVKEAQNLLKENPEATMLAIAFDAGFKSKSTFNDAFKKFAGMTPSEYKKTIK
ncbi:helix-turn-helix domain-containing protein [Leptobacterium sp. I13]|uniref:helix-turn-helix domain-containing protein n=1 Tax=Leptobacterium meishanense TaxID=3128904 RepID=UPI0030EB7854